MSWVQWLYRIWRQCSYWTFSCLPIYQWKGDYSLHKRNILEDSFSQPNLKVISWNLSMSVLLVYSNSVSHVPAALVAFVSASTTICLHFLCFHMCCTWPSPFLQKGNSILISLAKFDTRRICPFIYNIFSRRIRNYQMVPPNFKF